MEIIVGILKRQLHAGNSSQNSTVFSLTGKCVTVYVNEGEKTVAM